MKIFIIIILLIFIIIIYKNDKYEHFTINDEITVNINKIFKTDYSYLEKMSNQIDELKKTEYITLPDNITNTGVLKINTKTPSSIKKIKVNNSINVTNKNNKDIFLDIYPKYFILAWATNTYIPKGWVICDGSSYIIDSTYTKLEPNVSIPANKTVITVPNFKGVALRGISELSKINSLVGDDKLKLNTNDLPRHEHWLPTAIDITKPYVDNIGFQYEKSFINADTLLRFDGLEYKCPKTGLLALLECDLKRTDCLTTCSYPSYKEANIAQLDTLKMFYTLLRTGYSALSKIKSNKQTYDQIQFASNSSITKINIPRLPPVEGINGVAQVKTTTNVNIYYGSSYDSYKNNDLIVTTGEETNINDTKLIDAPPPYCVLNYIIKLTGV